MEKKFACEITKDDKDLSRMSITVDKEIYKNKLIEIVEEYKPRIDIKGFRKGKAPTEIILKQYGPSLEAEMQEKLMQDAWEEISKEKNILTLGMPNLSKMEKENDTLSIVFEYYELPEMTLPDFASQKLEKDVYEITDKTVDEAYDAEIKRYSHFIEKPDGAEVAIGDKVSASVKFDKEEYSKMNKDIPLVATDDKDDILYSREVVGMKKGDTKKISTFVGDEKTDVVITVNKIEMPDLKDDTTDEEKTKMKEELKKKLPENAKAKAEQALSEKVVDALIENIKVEIPIGYLEKRIEDTVNHLKQDLAQRNSSMEEYTAQINKKLSDFMKEEEENVRKIIIRDMAFQKILDEKKDEVQIDEDAMKNYAEQMYQYYNYMGLNRRPKDEQKKIVNDILNSAQNRFAAEAVIDYLKKAMSVSEKSPVQYAVNQADAQYSY